MEFRVIDKDVLFGFRTNQPGFIRPFKMVFFGIITVVFVIIIKIYLASGWSNLCFYGIIKDGIPVNFRFSVIIESFNFKAVKKPFGFFFIAHGSQQIIMCAVDD